VPTSGTDVVDCVEIDESDDTLCAQATPVIIASAAALASKCFIISFYSW
jgi:hypothetical protein